jgi:soluble P-type ATPase
VDIVMVKEKAIALLVTDQERMTMKSALTAEETVKSPANIVMV